jgi:3'(2'), 5'-bisphosphate nucleotidase
MNKPYEKERRIAELAVQRASILTKRVLAAVDKGEISKSDDSPVTIADFAAQALLISAIHHNFPEDKFVGEETADALRENIKLQQTVWDLVSATHLDDEESEATLATPASAQEMLDIIDLGCGSGGREGRVWMLDPVDGTATFIRGEQYAVCLALVENGLEKVGVLGCPNLNLKAGRIQETLVDKHGYGLMLSAVLGEGATIQPMSTGALQAAGKIARERDVPEAKDFHFVDTTLASSLDLEKHRMLAEQLGASWPGTELWSSQMRYVALTVGFGGIMLRIPKKKDKRSYVWDHAGGHLIYTEAGGWVTDLEGKTIDFGMGRKLKENYGMVAASLSMHPKILAMVKELLQDETAQ